MFASRCEKKLIDNSTQDCFILPDPIFIKIFETVQKRSKIFMFYSKMFKNFQTHARVQKMTCLLLELNPGPFIPKADVFPLS